MSDDDDSQPGAGTGRGVAAEHAGADPLAGRAPADAASTSLVTSPTRAIRRRARLPSLSPEAAAYAAEAYAQFAAGGKLGKIVLTIG